MRMGGCYFVNRFKVWCFFTERTFASAKPTLEHTMTIAPQHLLSTIAGYHFGGSIKVEYMPVIIVGDDTVIQVVKNEFGVALLRDQGGKIST